MVPNKVASTHLADIHDIKPLEPMGVDPRLLHYFLYGAMGIVLVGLIIVIFWVLKKRKRKKDEPVVRIPPHEAALTAVNALSERIDGEARAFYFDLSAILRGYVHERFDIGSLEMTTEELLPCISEIHLGRNLKAGLRSFLISSDPVKFAGYPVSKVKMESDLLFVKNFVEQTTPLNGTADG
jgi:hypothetical protein